VRGQLDELPWRGEDTVVKYDRTVLAYHGCDQSVAEHVLAGGDFKPSENDYDWLGSGIYFWEYGYDRALRFAIEQQERGKVTTPAVVGAIIQLGNCFDLMDTRFTDELLDAFEMLREVHAEMGRPLPANSGKTPDKKLRRLDCAVLNLYLKVQQQDPDEPRRFDSIRCGFVEGEPAFEGSGIFKQSHVQLAVRNPTCILGVFRPR
jgi:hypothetical protein